MPGDPHIQTRDSAGTKRTSYTDTLSKQWRQQSTLELHSAKNSHGHHMWTIQLPKHLLRHLDSSGETCSTAPTVREKAYNDNVLPVLNYAAAAWDPYLTRDINSLDKVQRRGSRYVCNNYWDRTPGCVSGMIQDLGWQSLQEKREDHRLTLLYKIQNNLLDIDTEPTLKRGDSRTRGRSRLQ